MRRTWQKSGPPKPSPEAVEVLGPYARRRLKVRALGLELPLDVPADVFATRAIDDGTLLLLRNLPNDPPGARLAASGRNQLVYSVAPGRSRFALDDESVYVRDETRLDAAPERVLVLSRPHDASEDPGHGKALGALLDAAPRTGPRTVLSFRCGYGALPLAARVRWPQAQVVAQDRDLLETAFLRRNAASLGLGGDRLRVVEALFPSGALPEGGAGLVLGA